MITKYFFSSIALCLGMAVNPALAQERTGNGGDPVIEREQRIRQLVANGLRKQVVKLVDANPNWDGIRDEEVKGILRDMALRGLRADAFESPYELRNECFDQNGIKRAATAMINDFGGPICIDARRLAEVNASDNEILALMIHEHGHHFGYIDAKMAINTAILNLLGPSSPVEEIEATKEVCKDVALVMSSENRKMKVDVEVRYNLYKLPDYRPGNPIYTVLPPGRFIMKPDQRQAFRICGKAGRTSFTGVLVNRSSIAYSQMKPYYLYFEDTKTGKPLGKISYFQGTDCLSSVCRAFGDF